MEQITFDKLKNKVWEAADILRGSIDSADYKNYIFGLLFLKRLSDVFEEEAEMIEKETGDKELAWNDPDEHQFFVPKRARWESIRKLTTQIGDSLNKACAELEDKNPIMEGVLASIDFNSVKLGETKQRDGVLLRLVQHFSTIPLKNTELGEPDLLGKVYEYLIEKFADDAGHKGNSKNISLYGQEKNIGTWGICKMNMLLHGFPDADIRKGDTIRDPKLLVDGQLMLFDRVIANPPFSLDKWGIEVAENDGFGRFRHGVPPKTRGDFAFVQHMVATINQKGKMGVVVPHGVLFRGAAEGRIREGMIKEDLIEAIIGLPTNLFYGTGIPAAIIIINKNKPAARKEKIFFINSSEEYQDGKNQNTLRDQDIKKIVTALSEYKAIDKYCKIVPHAEIKENDYNLNISRYIDVTPEEEQIDVKVAVKELRELEKKRKEVEEKMNKYLEELGVA